MGVSENVHRNDWAMLNISDDEIAAISQSLSLSPKFSLVTCIRGHAVAQCVEALRYKPERRGFVPAGVIGTFH
jgi:hypothetical protein